MKQSICLAIAFLLLIPATNFANHTVSESSVTDPFKTQVQQLTKAYLPLKDALVQTDAKAARIAAKNFLESLDGIHAAELQDSSLQYWTAQQQIIHEAAKNIAKTKDVDLQRQHFQTLSNALIHTLHTFEVPTESYYIQHCPMAFDNTGADWISDVATIRNPYFGDLMLACGYVKSGGKE